MKYRVRVNFFFNTEADARALLDYSKGMLSKATGVNSSEANEEVAFCELELCRHDEGLPCERLERVEIV
jgi:hypothetical protein